MIAGPAGEDLRPARRPAPSPRHRRLGHRARRRRTRRSGSRSGSTFGMSMKVGIPYSMTNTVVEFEENRRIAWEPRLLGEDRAAVRRPDLALRARAGRRRHARARELGHLRRQHEGAGPTRRARRRASRWSRRSLASRSSSRADARPRCRCSRRGTRRPIRATAPSRCCGTITHASPGSTRPSSRRYARSSSPSTNTSGAISAHTPFPIHRRWFTLIFSISTLLARLGAVHRVHRTDGTDVT